MKQFYFFTAALLACALSFLMPAQQLQAQTVWDGTADISWYDATQTSFDISTPEQLAGVAQLVNNNTTTFNGMTLNLTADIWLNSTGDSTNNWTPIGGGSPSSESTDIGNAFRGNFNGHGHKIYNLYCDKGNTFHGGLIACIQNPCTIDSLVMVNPVVKARGMMGAIAGFTRTSGNVYIRYCLVVNARLEAPVNTNNTSNNNSACIIGAAYNNTSTSYTYVQNCGATGTITGYYVAGICASGEHSNLENCYFAGSLNDYGSGEGNHGGMTSWRGGSGTVTNCYSVTNIPASNNSSSQGASDGNVVTQSYMQSSSIITDLGPAFKMDNGINNGYPVMSYMAGVNPISAEICSGESVTLTAFGYDSYSWSTGATTESITVSPTTTTTYTVTCTSNGTSTIHSVTVTVFPNAVVTATVASSGDGQVHATVTPDQATIGCGSTGTVQFTVNPDPNYRVSRVTLNGNEIYGDVFGEGPATITVNPNGTLGNVQIFLSNTYTITTLLLTDLGDTMHVSNLVQPYGTNGVNTVNAGDSARYTFNNTARWHLVYAIVDGITVMDNYYDFFDIHDNHTIEAVYTDSCGIASIPFSDDFENATTNSLPECYERISSDSYPYTYNYYAHSSSKDIYFYSNYTGTEQYFILPKVLDTNTYPLSSLMVTFYARVSSTSNTITIGTMTDPTDASTFTASQTFTNSSTGSYQEHTVYLGNAAHGEYIAIKGLIGSSYSSIYIDDITVDLAPTCSPVQNLSISNVYGTNATLSWDANSVGEMLQYNIYVHDLVNNTEASYSTTETHYTVLGLNETTAYEFGVFTSCMDGSSSDTVFVNATTPCNNPVALTIGNGTGTSANFPTSIYYNYSMTQQIYTADEMNNMAQDYASISFQYTTSNPYTRDLDIYVAHIPSTMNLSNGWIVPDTANNLEFKLIYSGDVTFNNTGVDNWFGITLDTVFSYNGADNVLLTVMDNTGDYESNAYFKIHESAAGMGRYYRSDYDGPFNYASMSQSGTASSNVNNIRFGYCDVSTCIRPNTLTITNLTESSADISWVSVGSESTWEIEYKASTDTGWTSYGTVSSMPATLSGLISNTSYSVRVRAICGNNDTSLWSDAVDFRTTCGAIDYLPYTDSFDAHITDNGTEFVPCWQRLNNSTGNSHYVYYSNSYNHSTTSGGVLDFHYTPSCYTMAVSPMIENSIPVNTIMVDFYARKNSGSGSGTFEIGVLTDPSDASTFELVSTVTFDATNTWEHKTIYLANYNGTGQYIAFRSANTTSYSYMLDDVTFDYIPQCMPPLNVTASNPTLDGATISWYGDASTYGIYAISGNDTTEFIASDTTYTLTGLQPSSTYTVYVRSLCGGDSSVISNIVTFNTLCGAITVTAISPWFEDFEGYAGSGEQSFRCWETPVHPNGPFVYCGHAVSCHSGANSAEFKGAVNVLVLPEFSNNIQELRLSFWATSTDSNHGNVEIGVITDPTDTSTFELVSDAGRPSERDGVGNYMGPFDFNGVTATSGRIALRYTNTYSSTASWNLDDFTVSLIPDCPSPVKNSVQASNVTDNSATITFTDNDATHTSWTVYYKPTAAGNDSWLPEPTNSTTVTLSNLNSSTSYDVYVITNCSTPSEIFDATNTIHFTTTQVAEALPFTATFPASGEWLLNNGSCNNYWTTGILDSTTNTNGLFVTNDGTTPGYNTSSTSIVTAEKLFTVGAAAEIAIEYDVLVGGESNYDYLKMFLAPATEEFPAATSAPTWASSGYSTYAYYFPTRSAYNLCLTNNTIHVSAIMPNPNTNPDATSTAKIVFVWKNDFSTGDQPGAVISNLTVSEVSCPQPINLSVSNINMTSADVAWTATGSESDWTLEYKESSGTNWNPIPVTGTASYQLTSLTAGTSYDLRVKADCGMGDESLYTTASFNTPLCDVTSQCNYNFNLVDTYGDGWNGASLDIQQNGITVANITLGSSYTTTESVTLCDNVSTSLVWHSGSYDSECSFSVEDPAGNVIFASSSTPSGTMYTFTTDCSATPQGPCTAPSNVVSSNISQTGATISWTAGGEETQWNLQYKSASDNDWSTSIQTNSPNYTIGGLTANTSYLVRVQAICTSGASDWSMTASFTTLQEGQETCYAPTDLNVNIMLSGTEVTLIWNQQGTPDNWTVSYKQTSSSSWSTATATTTSYTITNLASGTEYEAFVVANCGEQHSGESNHVTFTPTGINDYLLNSTTLYPNPTTGVFRIENSELSIEHVEVYDVYGKLLTSVEINDNVAEIDASGFASGVYFVRVITEKGMVTKRIVKR